MLDENESERKRYTLKPKEFERVNKPVHEEKDGPIEVSAILQQNIEAVEPQRQPPILPTVVAVSRKAKDFWLTLFLAALAFGVPAFLLRDAHLVLVCLISGFVVFAAVISWIFWVIMDRF